MLILSNLTIEEIICSCGWYSHSTMIDGLGVAGWGVGGIEAEATMLGQVNLGGASPLMTSIEILQRE